MGFCACIKLSCDSRIVSIARDRCAKRSQTPTAPDRRENSLRERGGSMLPVAVHVLPVRTAAGVPDPDAVPEPVRRTARAQSCKSPAGASMRKMRS
jgi:hypothetical protein